MPKLKVNLLDGKPLLDLSSHARGGPGRRDHLSPAQIAHISRTVRRVPEAVVKVLPRNSNDLASVRKHLDYVGRHGDLELETDDGDRLKGRDAGHQLMEDWDLDLDQHRRQGSLSAAGGRKPPKLVHKLMLSMPPGTPPQGVLAAARNFLREEFALKHRYIFVLHTDEPHPHVHAVVKAVSEQGERLNIRKATLRQWRQDFARHLRDQGIEANATERAVRGENRTPKKDGIYRAECRGASSHARRQTEAVAAELLSGHLRSESGKAKLVQTRREVERGWHAMSDILVSQGHRELAAEVRQFVAHMSPVYTERDRIAQDLLSHRKAPRAHDKSKIR